VSWLPLAGWVVLAVVVGVVLAGVLVDLWLRLHPEDP